jgi:hypothetical protein
MPNPLSPKTVFDPQIQQHTPLVYLYRKSPVWRYTAAFFEIANLNTCPNCGVQIAATEEKCPTCGEHVGAPNVRAAKSPDERLALERRYEAALRRAELRQSEKTVDEFRKAVENSIAVASCGLYPLRELASSPNTLYTNYYLGVRAEIRRAAELENDIQRRTVDAVLFGVYAEQIRFAALSIDGVGLKSYGKDGLVYGLGLRDIAIAKRASLLEENSFDFVRRHSLETSSEFPQGYRSDWENRHKLAVAKLADLIWPKMPPVEFAGLLLASSGDRMSDQFVEVHIFGTFNINALASVSGTSNPKQNADRAVAAVVKGLLAQNGIRWIEA